MWNVPPQFKNPAFPLDNSNVKLMVTPELTNGVIGF